MSRAAGQQPTETLPGFKAENVLEMRGVDNVNPFSGDPGVVIPIGPEYTLSSAYKWQLKAFYSVKYWDLIVGCSEENPVQYAYVLGDPTLGVGWALQLGYVVNSVYGGGLTYFSPDGGRRDFGGGGVAGDGSHLRLTAHGSPTTYYTVEFPDGTTEFFEQPFLPPRQASGTSPDFTNIVVIGEAPTLRYGLTRVQDRFNNVVLKVKYDDTSHPGQPKRIILNPDASDQGPTVFLDWVQTASLQGGTSISWWVVDYALFPAVGSLQRKVSFGYQMSLVARNAYDNSNSPGNTVCPQSPPNVADAPLLQSVTYSDSNPVLPSFAPFSYGFQYFGFPGTGELQRITLPTFGTIEYAYSFTTPTLSQRQPCSPDERPTLPRESVNDPVNFRGGLAFLDHSMAVVSRKETDTTGRNATTSYSRTMVIVCLDGVNCNQGDDSKVFRRVLVTAPGNDDPASPQPAPIGPPSGPTQFATRSYFTAPFDGLFSGTEVDRRSYGNGSDAGTPARALIRCYGSGGPTCGYRNASGCIQQTTGGEPPQAEVTWYGAVPVGIDGGTCSGSTPCTGSTNTDYNPTVGQYKTNKISSTLPLVPTLWERKTVTDWTPQTVSKWMLDLFDYKQMTESPAPVPNDVTTTFNFDLSNGFLVSSGTSDSYGSLSESFGNDGLGNPGTETRQGSGGVSGTPFTDNRAFQNGLLLTSQRQGIGWKSFDVDRDVPTGAITLSRDPNYSTQDAGHQALRTKYAYDALGRLTCVKPPPADTPDSQCTNPNGDAPTAISYDSTTQTTVSRTGSDGNGTWQRYLYDGFGRQIREIRRLPGGYATRTRAYDLADHPDFVSEWGSCASPSGDCLFTSPLGTTSSNFDPFGRPGIVTRADGSQTTIDRSDGTITSSDSLELVAVSVNGSQATTQTRRDSLGRVISVTEPVVGGVADVTNYTYNVLDKLATVSQSPQARTFTYDAMGFLRSENTPEKGLVNYSSYDALGDLLTQSFPPSGLTLNRNYDFAGRLTLLTSNEGGSRQYVSNIYDQNPLFNFSNGKLTTRYSGASASPDASDVFVYLDPAGRLSGQTTTVTGGTNPSVTQSWQYNSLGLVAHHYHYRPNGVSPLVVSTVYDSGLPVTEYVNGIPMVKNIAYQASGALASYRTGIGTGHDVTTSISPDLSGIPRPSQIFATEQASGVRLFDTNTYSYDGVGNILSMWPADTFAYDGRSRLTSASLSGLGSQYYCYDRFGNRVDKRSDPSCVPGTVWPDNRVPGAGNYDLRGNQTSNGSYSYDGLDRMTQQTAGTFTYLYDAANERLAKASSGTWTYTFRDEASRVSAEFTNAGGITTPSQDNIFLGNLLVASYSNGQLSGSGPIWTFYSSDHLGTPRLLTKLDGSVFETRKYWPFGDDTSGSTVQRLRFASMERDTEASRYYDHARSHEFNLGRFLSPDRVGGRLRDPQSWNRYAYARNNPLNYLDPNGRDSAVANEFFRAAAASGGAVTVSAGAATAATGALAVGVGLGSYYLTTKLLDISVGGLSLNERIIRTFDAALNGPSVAIKEKDPGAKPESAGDTAARQKGERATSGTAADAQEDLESLEKKQDKDRAEGKPDSIRSTDKTKQRFDERLRRVKSSKDTPDEFPE